jgi:hypothetical protein
MQGRQVKYGVRTEFRNAAQIGGAAHVSFDDFERPVRAGTGGLEMFVLPQPKVVDDQYLSAGFNQSLDEVRADETSPTCDQNTLHLDITP